MDRQIVRLAEPVDATSIVRDVLMSGRYDEVVLKDSEGREFTFRKNKGASILDALNR